MIIEERQEDMWLQFSELNKLLDIATKFHFNCNFYNFLCFKENFIQNYWIYLLYIAKLYFAFLTTVIALWWKLIEYKFCMVILLFCILHISVHNIPACVPKIFHNQNVRIILQISVFYCWWWGNVECAWVVWTTTLLGWEGMCMCPHAYIPAHTYINASFIYDHSRVGLDCKLFNALSTAVVIYCHDVRGWSHLVNMKGIGRKQPWPISGYYSGICLEGLRKNIGNLRTVGISAKVSTGHLPNTFRSITFHSSFSGAP